MIPPSPRRSNCLFWAVCAAHLFGARVRWRRSRNARWLPHFFVLMPDGSAWSYSPINPKPLAWDCPWFRGHVISEEL